MNKVVSANLSLSADSDLIKYVSQMNKKGIHNSVLIKKALRFYKDYGSKIKQLDRVDISNIVNNDDLKDYIANMVNEAIESKTLDHEDTTTKKIETKISSEKSILDKINGVKDLS